MSCLKIHNSRLGTGVLNLLHSSATVVTTINAVAPYKNIGAATNNEGNIQKGGLASVEA
jgi:hypothetical protein